MRGLLLLPEAKKSVSVFIDDMMMVNSVEQSSNWFCSSSSSQVEE